MTRWEQFYREREREEALSQVKNRVKCHRNRWSFLNHKKHPDGRVFMVMQNPTSLEAEMSVDITQMLDAEEKYDDIAEFVIKQLEQQGANSYRPTSPY